MDDPLQKEILLQLANTLPQCVIGIIISYIYRFLNKEYVVDHNNIDKVVDLGKDKIALITRKQQVLVYTVTTNILLYTLPTVDNLLSIYLSVLNEDKIIIGYLGYEGNRSEIRHSNTGLIYQHIPDIAIDNNNIVLFDRIILMSNYSVEHITHDIPDVVSRNNSSRAIIIDDNNIVIAFGSNLDFYDSKSITPYYSFCYTRDMQCSCLTLLTNNIILYYVSDINIFIWFDYKKREVISTSNTGLRHITQIYKISDDKGIIVSNYISYYNKMYLYNLNTGKKLLQYEDKETKGMIYVLGTLFDDTIVSSRGNNIIINNADGNCNYVIQSSQYSYNSVVLQNNKIVLFKPKIGTIAILS